VLGQTEKGVDVKLPRPSTKMYLNRMSVQKTQHIFPRIPFKADMKFQTIIPLDEDGSLNGLAPQPGPVIDAIEVFCFCVDLGTSMLNEIFR
jgi:hypothetical protein